MGGSLVDTQFGSSQSGCQVGIGYAPGVFGRRQRGRSRYGNHLCLGAIKANTSEITERM